MKKYLAPAILLLLAACGKKASNPAAAAFNGWRLGDSSYTALHVTKNKANGTLTATAANGTLIIFFNPLPDTMAQILSYEVVSTLPAGGQMDVAVTRGSDAFYSLNNPNSPSATSVYRGKLTVVNSGINVTGVAAGSDTLKLSFSLVED